MTAKLVVKKESGELLFDTSKICYGLVKSGTFTYMERWQRKYLRGFDLDPNKGSSWEDSFRAGDDMYGFSLSQAVSPIVFIVGRGCFNGSALVGSDMYFYYSGANASTKFYCFDLMRNDIPGGPYLKTFNEAGEITFNSLQVPLNVIASMGAPAPTGTDRYGRRYGYAGGRWELVRRQTANVDSQAHHLIDIPLSAGVEYAACLPWSRAANAFLGNALTGVDGIVYGMSEGAFGRSGGISFMFAPAGVTTQAGTPSNQYSLPGSFEGFPVDRSPTALVINTANYPFPYR